MSVRPSVLVPSICGKRCSGPSIGLSAAGPLIAGPTRRSLPSFKAARIWNCVLQCAAALMALDFPGYALGGFSVGETPEQMALALPPTAALLSANKPRYLMGVGRPQDILTAVAAGVDMFDCVLPTRNGRNASAFTAAGPLRLRNACHKDDPAPLEADCSCYTCRHFSRAYLHHLFQAGEMLGPTLLSLHNVAYYCRLMTQTRQAIREGRFAEFLRVSLARLGNSL